MTNSLDASRYRPDRLTKLAYWLWTVVGIVILARTAISPHINTVYTVFEKAGLRWLHGDSLYARAGEFLYSPLAGAFFAAFALLPTAVAGVLWRLLTGVPLFLIANAWLRKKYFRSSRVVGAALIALLISSVGNLNNGQASLLVLSLVSAGLILAQRGYWTLTAVCIGIATYFKIYPFVYGLLLAALYPKGLIWRLGVGILGLFLLTFAFQKGPFVLDQYRNWFGCLAADNRRLKDQIGTWRDIWLLLRLIGLQITTFQYALLQALSGASLAGALVLGKWVFRWSPERVSVAILILGGCWIVLFGPSTELATYAFLAPGLSLAVASILDRLSNKEMIQPIDLLLFGSYGWLILAECLNAWIPAFRKNLALHAFQPIGAIGFTLFTIGWLWDDRRWRAAGSQSPSPSNAR
jgi:hypothetical protein